MKLAVITDNISNLLDYSKIGADAFIFGLKGYSSGYNRELSIEEIKQIKNDYNFSIYVAINKNIFNDELEKLEEYLVELDKMKIDGVLFYDISILSIKRRLGLSLNLVWNQTHMVTNYNTCNYFYDKGASFGVFASEITLDEINEICKNTKMKFFLNIFGHQVMGYSRRNLLDNYFKSMGKEKEKKSYVLKNNDEEYIISQEDNGNAFYYGKVLNGSEIVPNVDVEYLILNDFNVDKNVFDNVLDLYKKLIDTKDEKYIEKLDKLVGKNRGFFYKKTIYKVKKNG